jgi:hypothetical protein
VAAVLEVAVGDQLPFRVGRQPALAAAQQLVDLVAVDPVVLVVVEHRQEHVEMREQIGQPRVAREGESDVAARAPRREPLVERQRLDVDRVAERLEDPPRQLLAAAAWDRGQLGAQRDRGRGQVGALVAAAGQRGAECGEERDAQQRGRGVRPVVDVLREPGVTAGPAHEADRVDVDQQRRGATVLGGVRIEHVRPSERQRQLLHAVGMLVQQMAEIGRRPVRGGERQQHERRWRVSVAIIGARRAGRMSARRVRAAARPSATAGRWTWRGRRQPRPRAAGRALP